MKAKTKRRIKHILTKKKLVSKKTSRHFFRSFIIVLATICTGSLAYAITITRPVVSVSVGGTAPSGRLLSGPPTPTPTPIGAVAQSGRGSWYALGLPAPDSLTCASRTFPRGTYLHVKDLYNGHSVVCLVNDYGPEIWTGRVIDLSRGSFREVDDLGRGTIPVEISVASGASGFNLPIRDDIAAVIGYNLCNQGHSAQYCDAHRQD